MTFTDSYPFEPPSFKFVREITHPNIYTDGKVCISILHAPGEDDQSGESADERWAPQRSIETVFRSILLLLDDPYIASPANVDAGVMFRDDREKYNEKAKQTVEASKKDIPEGFEMPKTINEAPPAKIVDDDDFWNEGEEDDFGASDSAEDFEMDEDDEGDQEFDDEEEQEETED